jgi:hypothetical protein
VRGAFVKKLVKLALIIGVIVVLAKVVAAKKSERQILTELGEREPSAAAPTDSDREGEEAASDDAEASEGSDDVTASA